MKQTDTESIHTLSETPVLIKIRVQHRDLPDGETVEETYTAHGAMCKTVVGLCEDGSEELGTRLCYREPTETGLRNTQTVLTFRGQGTAMLERSGDINCCWLLDTDCPTNAPYCVGLFRTELRIATERIDDQLQDDCGYAALEYRLNVRGQWNELWNRLELLVTPLYGKAPDTSCGKGTKSEK